MGGFVETLVSLGVALTLGLQVGLEWGWQERSAPEGRRVAGFAPSALSLFSAASPRCSLALPARFY